VSGGRSAPYNRGFTAGGWGRTGGRSETKRRKKNARSQAGNAKRYSTKVVAACARKRELSRSQVTGGENMGWSTYSPCTRRKKHGTTFRGPRLPGSTCERPVLELENKKIAWGRNVKQNNRERNQLSEGPLPPGVKGCVGLAQALRIGNWQRGRILLRTNNLRGVIYKGEFLRGGKVEEGPCGLYVFKEKHDSSSRPGGNQAFESIENRATGDLEIEGKDVGVRC